MEVSHLRSMAPTFCLTTLLAILALVLLPVPTLGLCPVPKFSKFAILLNKTVQEAFSPGATLSYKCRPGFFSKTFSLSCLPGSVWTTAPKCKKKSCPMPKDLSNGKFSANSFEFGEEVHYTCNDGFRLLGKSSAMCMLDENRLVWDQHPPICDQIPCENPPPIINGRITNSYTKTFHYGTVVTYECNKVKGRRAQLQMVGEKSIHCTSRDNLVGVWSGPAPVCIEPGTCIPPEVENILKEPEHKSLFHVGDTVLLQCKPGFHLEGSPRVTCQHDNKWEPELPRCARRCGLPPEILHGQHTVVQPGQDFAPGDQASYSCERGYQLEGESVLRCTPKGDWSPAAPQCTERPCEAFQDKLHHGNVRHPPSLLPGAKVSFVCDEGFHLRGSLARHCILEGGQTMWNGSTPECEKILCASPSPVRHGSHSRQVSGRVPYGEEVTYTCDPHPDPRMVFNLVGERTIRCGSDSQGQGVWSSPAPHCELAEIPEQSCMVPPTPLNGRVQISSDTHVGSTAHYSCEEGYRLTGSPMATCIQLNQSVTWDKEVPYCEQILCASPPPVFHGSHSRGTLGRVPYGEEVTYTCDSHPDPYMTFELIGERTIHCGSDSQGQGMWSGPAPQCKPSGTPACPPPPKILHGHLISGHASLYRPGMSIIYGCDPGYVLVGMTSMYCTDLSTWSVANPACTEITCQLPHFMDGIWKFTAQTVYRYGDNVTVQCEEGRMLVGSPHSQCQADGTWAPPLALCTVGAWPVLVIGLLAAVILFILLLIALYWLSIRFRKGNSQAKKCEEVSIHLYPQEDKVCVHALSLQTPQENTRYPIDINPNIANNSDPSLEAECKGCCIR